MLRNILDRRTRKNYIVFWTFLHFKAKRLLAAIHLLFIIILECRASPVEEPLLLDHGEVPLPALLLRAVVVAHRPGHLLVVHLLAPVHLHPTPRPGKLGGACHLGEQANEESRLQNSGYGRPLIFFYLIFLYLWIITPEVP